MKMYPDYTVEGTPEEVAAFKHIDAALAARNHRAAMRAIEAPKKAAPKKVTSKRGPYRTKSKDTHDQVLKLIAAKDGISAAQIAEYLEIPRKTAYNCLYGMTQRGEVVRDGKLYHRVPVNA